MNHRCLIAIVLAATSAAVAAPTGRFTETTRHEGPPATWVALDGERLAWGSAERLFIDGEASSLGFSADDGVLMGEQLFLVGEGELRHGPGEFQAVELSPLPVARLRVTRGADDVIVAEDGFGLRWITVPRRHVMPGHEHHAMHEHDLTPHQSGALELAGVTFTAIAAFDPYVYAATIDRRLLVVDSHRRALVTEYALEQPVHALIAGGPRLLALGDDGLREATFDDGELRVVDHQPDIGAADFVTSGRRLWFADARGLAAVTDGAQRGIDVNVSVGDNFFSPSNITIDVGDTVQWSNPAGGFSHNVRSCVAGQSGCPSVANEAFFSGAPTTAFTFQHTFATAGVNPYVCQVHALFMTGRVTVNQAVSSPPGVPAMSADKLAVDGSSLSVAFDTTTCSADDHHIVFGTDADLPASLGGGYGVGGATCAIGTTSPFVWNGSPAVAPGQFAWWLVLANNGSDEGSWGKASGNLERNGPASGGSSGTCALGGKDLAELCGQ